MGLRALVVEEAWKSGVLCHRRGCAIRLELAGKLLLQSLDRVAVEVPDAPEEVHAIRRRMEDVARTWQVLTRLHTGEDGRGIVVSIEENVSDRANRVARARAAARRNGVHADEDVVLPRVHRP